VRLSTDYQGDRGSGSTEGPKPAQVSTEYQKQAFQYHGYDLPARLRRHVAALEGVRHPIAAPAHHRAARDYVAEQLQALGLAPELLPFRFHGRTHHNVRALLPGRDPSRPRLLLAAHYDSTAETPGADDNASGVAALLECARLLLPRALAAGIEFVGLDLEELHGPTYRVGSRRLAQQRRARGERLAGALILEMVGYRDRSVGAQIVPPFLGIDVPRTGDFLAAVGDAQSRALLDGFVTGARAAAPELPIVPYRTRLRGWLLPLTRLSDNASFWDAGYPALMLTDTAFLRNPHYHRRSDTSATLDFEFMAQVTEAVAGAAVRLAGGD
jgi:Peptidase family M28